jgi:hypothetical protein
VELLKDATERYPVWLNAMEATRHSRKDRGPLAGTIDPQVGRGAHTPARGMRPVHYVFETGCTDLGGGMDIAARQNA